MDAGAWMRALEAVAGILSEYDPANAEHYRQNAARYGAEVKRLDDYARRAIGSIPKPNRMLVTAHDAFNYFGRAYDIEVLGIQGISTESEAGLEDINRLIDTIVKRQVKAVFVETSVADKNVRALVEGAQSRGHALRIGGSLFSDAMGEPGTYEGTYLGMMDHNVTIITRALGGEAPERGLNGKLK
jgi:manganese/zinc/iron transport system substrate-binding protein